MWGQAFDAQVVGYGLFEPRLEFFKVVLQGNREAFRRTSELKGTKVFFVWSDVELSSTVVTSDHFKREFVRRERLGCVAWVQVHWCGVVVRFAIMEKTERWTKGMRAAKARINVEKKNKKSKFGRIASVVMGLMLNPHVNQGRAYIRYVYAEFLRHPAFKSDLVVGLACLAILCCSRYPGDKLWIVMPGCFRSSVFVVACPKNRKSCKWMITLNLSMTCGLFNCTS